MKHRLSPPPAKMVRTAFVAFCCLVLLVACGNNMRDESRWKPYEPIEGNVGGTNQSNRPIDPNTVARSQGTQLNVETGKVNGAVISEFPITISRDTLVNGQQRYAIFCTPCHGAAADGKGVVAGYWTAAKLQPPANLLDDRLRAAPVGHFFDVITNGYGGMYSYASRVAPEDRWAIIAYIRALQVSKDAPLDVPPAQIQSAGAAAGGAAK